MDNFYDLKAENKWLKKKLIEQKNYIDELEKERNREIDQIYEAIRINDEWQTSASYAENTFIRGGISVKALGDFAKAILELIGFAALIFIGIKTIMMLFQFIFQAQKKVARQDDLADVPTD